MRVSVCFLLRYSLWSLRCVHKRQVSTKCLCNKKRNDHKYGNVNKQANVLVDNLMLLTHFLRQVLDPLRKMAKMKILHLSYFEARSNARSKLGRFDRQALF